MSDQFYTVTLPAMGNEDDSVDEATVSMWLAQPGARLRAGDDLLEVTTDKAAFVVPCPVDGVLREQLVQEDQVVRSGDPLAVVVLCD
ncbi:MAG TPA: lipoyl domain-containing protein [Candidatus Hydrogenedentes bacterium]|nr:lipoyl domain-containing protein [Candidatus Hydrogenedentota bacterium]HOK90798.1 lipoyl domain-containing protein [Candidatus Hydrogenedentota bacterium]HOV61495.1 lipoyl domain-containing protein [Candidatus Hydrogenedentota bacterium]HPO29708.1 lipoyl domain-containing protein [Candidatus Hydrogenedentota bacterium]